MNVVIVPAGVAVGLDTDSFSPFHGARVASWEAPYLDVAEPRKLKNAKDYSVGDGGQGVEGKGVKYVGDGAVMYRIIFSRS